MTLDSYLPVRLNASVADRLLIVLSDIEMGAGGPYDDFPHSDFLADIVLSYTQKPFRHLPIDLVLNGDTFDLLKTSYDGAYPHHITQTVALGKLDRVAQAHPRFFSALQAFLAASADNYVHFVVGNHDAELLFSGVQDSIRARCGGSDRVLFPGMSLDLGRVHIEHGSQADPLFQMDASEPFVMHKDVPLLNISWGTVALLNAIIPMQPLFYFHDRLKPRRVLMELMPELKDVLIGAMWNYWTADLWKNWVSGTDPVKRVKWTMFKEVTRRFVLGDTGISISHSFMSRAESDPAHDLWMIGHEHDAGWISSGKRKLLNTGCLRNEWMVTDGGKVLEPIPKTYGEVYLKNGLVLSSHLVEVVGPPVAAELIPQSIFDVLPDARALLASPEQRRIANAKQRAQEEQEAAESRPAGPGASAGASASTLPLVATLRSGDPNAHNKALP